MELTTRHFHVLRKFFSFSELSSVNYYLRFSYFIEGLNQLLQVQSAQEQLPAQLPWQLHSQLHFFVLLDIRILEILYKY